MTKPQARHIQNAAIWNGDGFDQRDLYTTDVVLAERPKDALTVDLSGYTIFPGLINAHDHLELNHYPRTKYRERYDNASQWSADVNSHLNESPFKELRAYPLADRCFIGGLKNLLCGATTVVHHNPPHKCLFRSDFPVRVLKKYGWAHSLYLSREEEIVASYQRTPPDVPWFIHLAEGTDDAAKGEYQRLKAMGCIGKNTIIVHGVGLQKADLEDALTNTLGFVWCPSTNQYLLGDFHRSDFWLSHWVCIGSDSRVTADGDLLDDLRLAFSQNSYKTTAKWLMQMVTEQAHHVLNCGDRGRWWRDTGWRAANLIALHTNTPDSTDLIQSHRADLALVVRGGVPQIGNPDVMAKFPQIETVRARLDDTEKSINVTLAQQIARCTLKEPGLELLEEPQMRRRWRIF